MSRRCIRDMPRNQQRAAWANINKQNQPSSRHHLTSEERLRGVEKALLSPRTPRQFKPELHRQKKELEEQVKK